MVTFMNSNEANLQTSGPTNERMHDRLEGLHTAIQPRIRNHNLDLHPRWQKSLTISQESASAIGEHDSQVLTYFRSREQAEMVEKLMGKDDVSVSGNVETYRHPVIELRHTPDYFAVELILSPYAWWDQQNFVGKLSISNHRAAFRNILSGMNTDYRLGFWNGTHLGDMHLTIGQLLKGRIMDEWIDTFADRLDWLRIGKWYSAEDPALDTPQISVDAFEAVKELNEIYSFILWTSNNNFHDFYEKRQRSNMRRNLT